MDFGNYSSQSHVAQQSRRDKLRVQHSSHQLEDNYNTSNLDHISVSQPGSNPRYGNISYNPALISPEMLDFAANSQLLLSHKQHQEIAVMNQEQAKVCSEPQNIGSWVNVGAPQRNSDWVGNYSGEINQNACFVRETKIIDPNSSPLYPKPSFTGYYQDVDSSTSQGTNQNSLKNYEEMHFSSSSFYQNALPLTVVASATNRIMEGSELASAMNHQSNRHFISSNELSSLENKSNNGDFRNMIASDSTTQGLSLSLSPINPNKEGLVHPNTSANFVDHHKLKALNYSNNAKPNKIASSGKLVFGSMGPLGPFTGYATILKSSKFLKPAQQLLDDICVVNAAKSPHTHEMLNKVSNDLKGSNYNVNDVDDCGDSVISSPTFRSSNENCGAYQQKKAKLLCMQEEVCRRHKQYHQQMELVFSSFESVAGLGAATPFISLAINTVSRHFRSVKKAISDQLKQIRKALGENFSTNSVVGGSTSTKDGTTSPSRFKFSDQSLIMKQKGGGSNNLGFLEPQLQQNVWRPQRGLPDRAVSILRAWLFEHFLHPYPTDADKHMLASQTGLSRNQVSNWFINARVRVWKPMVEEIHTLETNNLAVSNSSPEGVRSESIEPENLSASTSNKQVVGNEERWTHAMDKRSRIDQYQIPVSSSTVGNSYMNVMPYQRSRLGLDSSVSLTLGLRQSAEEVSAQQQQQYQLQEHKQQQYFGGHMVHDYVG